MRRREFLTFVGGLAISEPLPGHAQQPAKAHRIGMLDTVPAERNRTNLKAFREELVRRGYVEGENLRIDYRSSEGRPETFVGLVAELLQLKVDAIVTRGTPAARAAKDATAQVPIIMAAIGEPLQTGVVGSLTRPGGNITGFSSFATELTRKRLELLRETVGPISRVMLLDNMRNGSVPAQWEETRQAASIFGISAQLADVSKPEEIPAAFESMKSKKIEALLVGLDSVVIANAGLVAELAVKYRLPAMYASREFVEAGGLISYGTHYGDLYRRAAAYVDRVFHGTNPGELPIEQPTRFEFLVNLKAAEKIGLVPTPQLLARADEVIE